MGPSDPPTAWQAIRIERQGFGDGRSSTVVFDVELYFGGIATDLDDHTTDFDVLTIDDESLGVGKRGSTAHDHQKRDNNSLDHRYFLFVHVAAHACRRRLNTRA